MNTENIYIDAVGLARDGKQKIAFDILSHKYAHLSTDEVNNAISLGKQLNDSLWLLADKYYDKSINEAEFKDQIRLICPSLSLDMINGLFSRALYEAR